jgi:hypothetical protein
VVSKSDQIDVAAAPALSVLMSGCCLVVTTQAMHPETAGKLNTMKMNGKRPVGAMA